MPPERNYTLLLVTDVETQGETGGAQLTEHGLEQLARMADSIRLFTGDTTPQVVLATNYTKHRTTANALRSQFQPEARLLDWGVGGYQALQSDPGSGVRIAQYLRDKVDGGSRHPLRPGPATSAGHLSAGAHRGPDYALYPGVPSGAVDRGDP
jgi:hypothetical protein